VIADLVAWLRTQLDSEAQTALGVDEYYGDEPNAWQNPNGEFHGRGGPIFEHVLRWDPARVLADIDAKRRLLDWEDQWGEDDHTARLLALPYAGAEGWQERWRP